MGIIFLFSLIRGIDGDASFYFELTEERVIVSCSVHCLWTDYLK